MNKTKNKNKTKTNNKKIKAACQSFMICELTITHPKAKKKPKWGVKKMRRSPITS